MIGLDAFSLINRHYVRHPPSILTSAQPITPFNTTNHSFPPPLNGIRMQHDASIVLSALQKIVNFLLVDGT
jgi:hypothetical protein